MSPNESECFSEPYALGRIFKEAKMANERWYVLKLRPGFEPVVAKRLRKLNLEVLVPNQKPTPRDCRHRDSASPSHLYCRFSLENRLLVTGIPGVLDILGTPEPIAIEPGLVPLPMTTHS
jgi:hypothetical protein